MSTLSTLLTVAGAPIPIDSFNVTGGSTAAAGHLTASTTIARLNAAGINLTQMAIQSDGLLEVDAYAIIDGAQTQIFGGEYLTADWDYNSQSVDIHARDWSGPLIDQKRVLVNILDGNVGALAPEETATTGVSTQNQKLSQIITAIANQFSLTPDLRLGQGSDPDIGSLFGDATNTILTMTPQSLWGILNKLARETGNIVYTTPQKHLVFGEPGAGLDTIQICYRINPTPDGSFAALKLRVQHNPRRNMTFQVVVLSYDPTKSQLTKGRAYVIGSNYSTSEGSTVHAGLWSGNDAANISAANGSGSKSKKIPIYTFHLDGLTQAQAQQRAQAIAYDIARRELIARADVDILPNVAPSNPATLQGQIDQEFIAHQYFVTHYTHRFRMPKGDGEHATFDTSLVMLDNQPVGSGSSVGGEG